MDKKFDTSEIVNPKKTLVRREAEADGKPAAASAPPASAPSGGIEFFNGKRKPVDPAQKERNRKKLEQMLRERDAKLKASTDQFEEEFAKDSEAPLTDAVRAARREAGAGLEAESDAYAMAYNDDKVA